MEKNSDAYRTIGEAAEELNLPQHVLRFWETRFSPIRPMKRSGGRRYYRPDDLELLASIRHLLYGEGYTIKGVQRILKQQGARAVVDLVNQLRAGSAAGDAALAGTAPMISVDDADQPDAGIPASPSDPQRAADATATSAMGAHPQSAGMPASAIEALQAVMGELEACRQVLATARGR